MSNLIEYGIQNYEAKYCIHVGFLTNSVFVFSTDAGVDAINSGAYPHVKASQFNEKTKQFEVTAKGHLVPPNDIVGCKEIKIPRNLIDLYKPYIKTLEKGVTTEKGEVATLIVAYMFEEGHIPIALITEEIKNKKLQLKGNDIFVIGEISIQIKCDFRASSVFNKNKKTTGNLFLQTHERNPNKLY